MRNWVPIVCTPGQRRDVEEKGGLEQDRGIWLFREEAGQGDLGEELHLAGRGQGPGRGENRKVPSAGRSRKGGWGARALCTGTGRPLSTGDRESVTECDYEGEDQLRSIF